MVWVDRLRGEIKERFAEKIARKQPLVIRDEKTLSGRVHIGSLRGIVIHGLVAQVLAEAGIPNVFRFELNDFDPMDEVPASLPQELREKYLAHMGEPLWRVPDYGVSSCHPEPVEGRHDDADVMLRRAQHDTSGSSSNYPLLWGRELQETVAPLRLPIEWYTLRPHYERGEFNDVIRDALDNAAGIRAIYREVSGSVKPDDWFPLQVVCEKCGKIGTTQVIEWSPTTTGEQSACHTEVRAAASHEVRHCAMVRGSAEAEHLTMTHSLGKQENMPPGLVTYHCKPDLVTWAKGCGHTGTISPFDGNAKLPWKVEWPAKWKVFGVDIEGCGKDHSAAGGSRDIGRRIATEIFHYQEPFNIPYEFFNLAGKKMSASKGIGASAKEVSDMLPPELLKLLMIRKLPNHPIDFDPDGDTVPLLFDEYDRLAEHCFKRHTNPDPDYARTFHLTQIDFPQKPKDAWQMRFSLLSFVLQMPHLRLEEEATKMKGTALTEEEKTALRTRAQYVEKWLSEHAPEEYRFTILPESPTLSLDDEQRSALRKLLDAFGRTPWEGAKLHEAIHAVKATTGIDPKRLFQPLYQAFLGRDNGPQMGWFLGTMEREDVMNRLNAMLR